MKSGVDGADRTHKIFNKYEYRKEHGTLYYIRMNCIYTYENFLCNDD